MIAACWLLFRTSSLRWAVPLAGAGCLLLTAGASNGPQDTSMQASAEAALTVLLWAPLVLLMSFMSLRSTGPQRADDVLVLALDRRSRQRRAVSAIGTPVAWSAIGWIGFWAGCGVLAARGGTPIYWSMALNGLALSTLAAAAGGWLAVLRAPAWIGALAASVAYLGLAVWTYVPDVAASVLYSPYGPLFLTDALPSTGYLVVQALWAVGVVSVLVAWCSRAVSAAVAVIVCLVLAAATTWVTAPWSDAVPRSGRISLHCAPHSDVQVCLWADHEATRDLLNAEVDLARKLIGGDPLPAYLSEGDYADGPPQALPPGAPAALVIVSSTVHPSVRDAAAQLVAASIQVPATCPDLTTEGPFAVPVRYAVERVVRDQVAPGTAGILTDSAIARWLSTVERTVRDCREPLLP